MEIEAGRVLSGRYRLIRPLGQGSQAAVWLAEHLALTTQVAVKLIDPELAKREDALERFRREATAAAQLRSAHVVQILDHGIDGVQPFIVMELLDGEDLFERLDKRGRLTLRETSKIVTQVARALNRAHAAGIIHRDLKPENVFLVTNEDEEVVKVFDFGVAKVTDPSKAVMQKTSVGQLIGTPHYMSPEQVKGTGEVDLKADLWALGVITYQCVTGDLPFDSEGVGDLLIKITMADVPVPSKVLPGLPPSFDQWFAKACNRDPAMRFESARELAEALARAVRGASDAPGVASIPRPVSGRGPAAPVSVPPVVPAPVASKPPPPPAKRVEVPMPPAPKVPAKRAATEQLGADEFEEVMDFDEEVKAAPPPAKPKDARATPPPPVSGPVSGSKTASAPPGSMPPSGAAMSRPAPPPLPSSGPSSAKAPAPPAPPAAPPVAPPAVTSATPPAVTSATPPAVTSATPLPEPASPVEEAARATPPPPSPAALVSAPPPPPVDVSPAPAPEPPHAESASQPPQPTPTPLAPMAPVISSTLLAELAPPAAPAPPQAARAPEAFPVPPPAAPPPLASPPRPPAPAPTNFSATAPPATVPAYSGAGLTGFDAPPEFDGSRRKRLVKYFTVGLIAAAVLITWAVVSSQIPPQGASPQDSASIPQVIEPAPPPPQPTESPASSAAVDPIKPAASATAEPTVKPKRPGKPGPPRKTPAKDDMTIEIPTLPSGD
jgi:serine/threonine-protein kinase